MGISVTADFAPNQWVAAAVFFDSLAGAFRSMGAALGAAASEFAVSVTSPAAELPAAEAQTPAAVVETVAKTRKPRAAAAKLADVDTAGAVVDTVSAVVGDRGVAEVAPPPQSAPAAAVVAVVSEAPPLLSPLDADITLDMVRDAGRAAMQKQPTAFVDVFKSLGATKFADLKPADYAAALGAFRAVAAK